MNSYHFTDRVRSVFMASRLEAKRLHHEYVGTEHILLALTQDTAHETVAGQILRNLSIDTNGVRRKIEEVVKQGKADVSDVDSLPYTSRAKHVLELAMTEARELHHNYVGTEHLLLGLVREQRGIAAQVLTDAGVTLESARATALPILGQEGREPVRQIPVERPSGAPVAAVSGRWSGTAKFLIIGFAFGVAVALIVMRLL